MQKRPADFSLYRLRFLIGYLVAGTLIAALVVVAVLLVPGGLSDTAMKAATTSGQLSFKNPTPSMIINAPFHLLQRASIDLLGLSELSIKLPTAIFGVLSLGGIFLLLSLWFKKNIAILTTLLVVTTGQLLYLIQSGSTGILYVFWSVALLLFATLLARKVRAHLVWASLLGLFAALSLYTPLSIYLLIALIVITILHPHLRITIRRLPTVYVLIGGFVFLLLVAPLAYALMLEPTLGLRLLGVSGSLPPDLLANGQQIFNTYFNFAAGSSDATLMTPIYGLGSVALILLGVIRLATTKYTARSYLITTWLLVLVPLIFINPLYTSVTFVPLLLLMGMGLELLLRAWYRLFPLNPYARFAGLLPLTILLGGLAFSGIDRYLNGYHYTPSVASNFSRDLRLIDTQLARLDPATTTIVVPQKQQAFYTLLKKQRSGLTVATTTPETARGTVLVTKDATSQYSTANATTIVSTALADNPDRLYIYKFDDK